MSGAGGRIPVLTEAAVRVLLPDRPRDSHKGKNGRALLCVGSGRYTGAALLCAAEEPRQIGALPKFIEQGVCLVRIVPDDLVELGHPQCAQKLTQKFM